MEVTNGVGVELLALRQALVGLWQAADAMALQAAMQRGPRQLRDRLSQGVETVIERQQRVLPEGDDGSPPLRCSAP